MYRTVSRRIEEEIFLSRLEMPHSVVKGTSFNDIHLLQIKLSGAQHLNALFRVRLYIGISTVGFRIESSRDRQQQSIKS